MEMGRQTRGDGQRVSLEFFFFFFTRQGQGRMLRLGSWHLEDDVPRIGVVSGKHARRCLSGTEWSRMKQNSLYHQLYVSLSSQ